MLSCVSGRSRHFFRLGLAAMLLQGSWSATSATIITNITHRSAFLILLHHFLSGLKLEDEQPLKVGFHCGIAWYNMCQTSWFRKLERVIPRGNVKKKITEQFFFFLIPHYTTIYHGIKVGFHTTDFIAIAQKAQELSVGACVE